MAGFQTASLLVSDHPVLYGTTLAISLVGSVAALSPSVVSVPVARVEYSLSLAETALAAVTKVPGRPAAKPAAVSASVIAGQTEQPVGETPQSMSSSPAERRLSTVQTGLAVAPHGAVPKLVMTELAARPLRELKVAPPAISDPAIAALPAPRRGSLASAPTSAGITAQPSTSFDGAFQAVPAPSLAIAAERPAEVRSDGPARADAAALSVTAALPGQSPAAFAAASIAPPADVQNLAAAPEPALALNQIVSQPSATSGVRAPEILLQAAAAKPAPAAPPLRLINSPQLRKFDLARIHNPARTPAPAPAPALAPATAKPSQAGKLRIAPVKDRLVGGVVYHQLAVTVAGSPAKALDVRIGADMIPSIRVGDLLGLVSDRMDPASAARFAAATSAGAYVSLATLRSSGFSVSYNAGSDSISISAAE